MPLLALLGALVLAPPVAFGEDAPDIGAQGASGPVKNVEIAVQRGVRAAASGVERGVKAAASGVERGLKAAASGVERGAKATAQAAGRVAGSAPAASAANPP